MFQHGKNQTDERGNTLSHWHENKKMIPVKFPTDTLST